jgi:hypothetical protein
MIHELSMFDVERLMKGFTYKPNFEFEVVDFGDSSCSIKVTMWTLDSTQTYPAARAMTQLSARALHGIGGVVTFPNDEIGCDRITVNLEPVKVGRIVPLHPYVTEEMFWHWLKTAVIQGVEFHEIDEWFKVNGVPLDDPHQDNR